MGLLDFLNKRQAILAVDIGATGIKLIELDMSEDKPRLVNFAHAPFNSEIFAGHAITRSDLVSEQLTMLIEANAIATHLGASAIPGPSVFTKKIKMPNAEPDELSANIQMEASNFIPQNIESVKLDYHIIGESGRDQLDILVAAVKTEIIESFVDSLSASGIESAVMDVDYFALQNAFELSYPESVEKTTALVNIGARYSAVNICRNGHSLFVGDVGVGGKAITDALAAELNVSAKEAEEKKIKGGGSAIDAALRKQIDLISTELNRQLSFFWNASGAEEGIDHIYISGGSALLPGLSEVLSKKTGIKTDILDPFRGIVTEGNIDPAMIKSYSPHMAIAVGLAIRQPGDRIIPEEL